MERGKATPAAAAEEEDDRMETCEEVGGGQMVAFELEAAAALAGLAWSSGGAVGSGEMERQFPPAAVDTSTHNPKDQYSVATENMRDSFVSTSAITVSERSDQKVVENTASQLCTTSCQSTKLRPKLTEAEKQARKLHRVLANRESARQTIRRRQALYLELAGKAAYLSEENENLKKEKEVAAKEYNSLKDRNEVLKAELAKLKKAELRGPQEDTNTSSSSRPDESSSANSIYLQNRPSVVSCFWPSLFPSSDILQSQCGPHLSYDTSSSQGQENPMGAQLLLFPVPFLLPFQTPNEGKNTENQSSICSCSVTRLNEDNNNNNNNNSNNNNNNSQVDDTSNANANDVSAPESATHAGSAEENREPVVSPREDSDDAIAATIARRRRKELMKMRNKHCYQQQHTR